MSACPALYYYGVTPEQWAAAKAEVAAEYKIEITSDVGTASEDGITIGWNFDGKNVSIQCTGKPFILSCDFVNSRIDAAVKAGLGR
jgi:hypothetical protein